MKSGSIPTSNEEQKKIAAGCMNMDYPINYPYSTGIYNEGITKHLNL